MSYESLQPRLFSGDKWGKRPPPGVKSFLFSLNLQMDWLLDKIQTIRWSNDPIIWAADNTEIEQLTLVLEDKQFYRHAGVDLRFIPRAFRQLITFKQVGGVSTIEQQLVRTILERRDRTLRRKYREMLLAWILSYRMAKRDILRTYLSTAYFGYRLRGSDETALLLYSISSPELNIEQAALIASLLVYPLPKIVREFIERTHLCPIVDQNRFLEEVSSIAPRWAQRIRRRTAHGLVQWRKTK